MFTFACWIWKGHDSRSWLLHDFYQTFFHCRWNLQQWCFQDGGSEFAAGDASQSLEPTSPETKKSWLTAQWVIMPYLEVVTRENIWANDNANCYIVANWNNKKLHDEYLGYSWVVVKSWHLCGWRARVFTPWQNNEPCSSHSCLTMMNQTKTRYI